jgi:hypothetical protein
MQVCILFVLTFLHNTCFSSWQYSWQLTNAFEPQNLFQQLANNYICFAHGVAMISALHIACGSVGQSQLVNPGSALTACCRLQVQGRSRGSHLS